MMQPPCRALVLAALAVIFCTPAVADLALNVEASPNPARPGETIDVVITATNTGGSSLGGVVITANVPTGVENFFETIARPDTTASCATGPLSSGTCEPGEQVVWGIGTLAPGQGISVHMPPIVASGDDAPADGTLIAFEAGVVDDDTAEAGAVGSVEVQSTPVLTLAVAETSEPVAPGAALGYTLSYANRSDAVTAAGTTLAVPVPAGTSFVSASDGGVLNAGIVTWTLGALSPGATGAVTLDLDVSGGVAEGSFLIADATLAYNAGHEARARAATRVQTDAPLGFAIELNRESASPGDAVHALLTVTNRSNTERSNVVVSVRVPDEADDFFETIARPDTTDSCRGGPLSSGTCEQAERLQWNIASLPPGTGVTVAMPSIVSAGVADGELIQTMAWAQDDTNAQAEAQRVTVVDAAPHLAVDVREAVSPVAPGADIVYTLTYANVSALDTAASALLAMPLPDGTTFVGASDGGVLNGHTVSWSLGNLSPGRSGAVTLNAALDIGAPDGSFVGAAATLSDAGGSQARAHAQTRVEDAAALDLGVELSADPVIGGDTLRALVTVTNRSGVDRSGVTITAFVPEHVENFFETIARPDTTGSCRGGPLSSGTCEQAERLEWNIGTVPAGGGVTVAMPSIVAAGFADGTLIDTIAWAIDDENAQARATRTAVIDGAPVLAVALDPAAEPVAPGDRLDYTIAYSNVAGSGVASGATIEVPLPGGTSFFAASDGGTFDGSTVSWALGSLDAGAAGAVTLALDVGAGLDEASLVRTRARLSDLGGNEARAGAETRVEQDGALAVAVELAPDPLRPGDTLHALVTVINRSDAARDGVFLTAFVPDHVENFFESIARPDTTGSCRGGPLSSGTCEQAERLEWNLGSLAAGAAVTVAMPVIAADTAAPGMLLNTATWARDDGNAQAVASASAVSLASSALQVEMAAHADPVGPGELLAYTIDYGQVEPGAGAAQLRASIPENTTFVSATDGGVVSDGAVVWSLPGLDKGEGGQVSMTVSTDAGLADGSFVRASAVLSNPTLPDQQARAVAIVRARMGGELLLAGDIDPAVLLPGDTHTAEFTVTNAGVVDATGVTVTVLLADEIDDFFESDTDADATESCRGGPLSTGTCEQAERLIWNVGTLAPSASATVVLPVTNSVTGTAGPNGQVLRYRAIASDDAGNLVELTLADYLGDRDGVADYLDNCLFVANAGQVDADADGIGNICDADLDNDCAINFLDLGLMKEVFFTPDPVADLDASGSVNFSDLGLMKQAFFGSTGPSGVPNICD